MNLTLKKLKLLWERDKNKSNFSQKYFERAKSIYSSLDEIEDIDISNVEHEKGFFGPAKQGIPTGSNDGGVKAGITNMKTLFNNEACEKQIDLICNILNVPKRNKDYRLFSNASQNSPWETPNTKVGMSTADMYFISNNYFYNISKLIQLSQNKENFEDIVGVEEEKVPLVSGWDDNPNDETIKKQIKILNKKFVTKYLWMLGNKTNVITIFSLRSFYNLEKSGLLKELEFKNTSDSSFKEFTSDWEKTSQKIYKELNIIEDEEKIFFSKWLFMISLESTDIKNISDLLQSGNKAVILWGPPGTGKTYESEAVVKELLEVSDDEDLEEKYLFSKQLDKKGNFKDTEESIKGYYEIIQFHPNYTYQDFIGGISPYIGGKKSKDISYILRKGIFKKFCDEATKEENENKKFIFIIDEINRAELSAVFGELLYALEYRGKSINLPHFGEFTIPKNVYIIGTMNNVDKSLVTFDLALRRRFGFFKLMPKLEVLQDVLSEYIEKESLTNYYEKCKKLNEDIVKELDLGEDYQIGQAYFLKIKDFIQKNKDTENLVAITSFELEKLWVYNIEPLLEEYLGMSIEDENILSKLKNLKDEFLKDN